MNRICDILAPPPLFNLQKAVVDSTGFDTTCKELYVFVMNLLSNRRLYGMDRINEEDCGNDEC
jgi:hypothetical protein